MVFSRKIKIYLTKDFLWAIIVLVDPKPFVYVAIKTTRTSF